MNPETYTANTKDWIKSNEGMKLIAFVDSNIFDLHSSEETFTRTNFLNALERVSTPFKRKKVRRSKFVG